MPRAIGEAILKNKSKCSSCEKDIFKLRLTIENHTNGLNKIRETLNSRYWVTRRSGNLSVALVSDDIIHMSERVAVSIIHCDLTMRSTRLYSYLDALLIKSTLQMLERICAFCSGHGFFGRFLPLSALLLCIEMTLEPRPPESCSLGL